MKKETVQHRNISVKKPIDVSKLAVQYRDEGVFANLRVTYQILLAIALSVASNERSFGEFTLILTYLRSTMGHELINDSTLMGIERELLEAIHWDEIVINFAEAKVRKVKFK